MIKRLRRKFIGIAMLSLSVVILLVIGTINGINIYQMGQKSESLLEMLSENEGTFPQNDLNRRKQMDNPEGTAPEGQFDKPIQEGQIKDQNLFGGFRMSEETPFETRYFSVKVDEEGNQTIDITHVASISEEDAQGYATQILSSQKTGGYIGQYRYRLTKTDTNTLLVFVDCRNDISSIQNFALISLLVGAVCILLVLFLIIILSNHAIRPMIESMQKQKQFITDAGHEIKTPIAIISANTEVLEMCDGENEWTISIHHQVDRLNELVKNLLTLAKLDEAQEKLPMTEFPVGKVIREISDNFDGPEQTKDLTVEKQIDETLKMSGDENSIRHLISILLDNAVKYSNPGGEMSITTESTEKHVMISVYNTCEEIPQGDLSRLFDRFYRADSSRSRESGGYGIGLSVAAAITQAHKGKIEASRQDEGICFKVTLPRGM